MITDGYVVNILKIEVIIEIKQAIKINTIYMLKSGYLSLKVI